MSDSDDSDYGKGGKGGYNPVAGKKGPGGKPSQANGGKSYGGGGGKPSSRYNNDYSDSDEDYNRGGKGGKGGYGGGKSSVLDGKKGGKGKVSTDYSAMNAPNGGGKNGAPRRRSFDNDDYDKSYRGVQDKGKGKKKGSYGYY